MTPDLSSIPLGTSLSISISGTARLQHAAALRAANPDREGATEIARYTGHETASQALSKASVPTRQAIEQALRAFSPGASLANYTNGKTWSNGSGVLMHLTA